MSHQSSERQASSGKSASTSVPPARRTRTFSSPREVLQRAQVDPASLTPADVLQLQRTVGNRATGRLLAQRLSVQTKLQLGPANDKYEQEADAVARQVVRRMAAPPVQRGEKPGETTQAWPRYDTSTYTTTPASQPIPVKRRFEASKVQREEMDEELAQASPLHGLEGGDVESSVAESIQRARGGGNTLDPKTRAGMEGAFGASFGGVRIHTDLQADTLNRSLNARAFTTGNDIFFRRGEYNPGSSGGKELLAHELTHTVQQGASLQPAVQRDTVDPSQTEAHHILRDSDIQRQFTPAIYLATPSTTQVIQRDVDENSETPYDKKLEPPKFEYWVNSMWKQVKDEGVRKNVLTLLGGGTPKTGDTFADEEKKKILHLLYENAYQQRAWVSASELLEQGALEHQAQAPISAINLKKNPIAIGFHATWRDPDTVLNLHGGTVPTVERYGPRGTSSTDIKKHLKSIGIEEWHPFWFGGDIVKRPFLFRNKEEDNELDTTISVAKSASDSLDFPLLNIDSKTEYDEHGFPVLETYLYVVGTKKGFNTSSLQGETQFGEGEIATDRLDPDQHFGYIRYRRVFAGTSRNDGYYYERIHSDILPGARKHRISDQIQGILNKLPKTGFKHGAKEKLDVKQTYEDLFNVGKEAASNRVGLKKAWMDAQWEKWGMITNNDYIKYAPSEKVKQRRLQEFLKGVRSVLPEPKK